MLKPKHFGFFSTTLETLLHYLGADTLILTGIAGNICVFYTANDAYMRDFTLFVPLDCTVSNTEEENRYALDQMQRFLKADTRPSDEIDLKELLRNHGTRSEAIGAFLHARLETLSNGEFATIWERAGTAPRRLPVL